jgi:hypothetical protein
MIPSHRDYDETIVLRMAGSCKNRVNGGARMSTSKGSAKVETDRSGGRPRFQRVLDTT